MVPDGHRNHKPHRDDSQVGLPSGVTWNCNNARRPRHVTSSIAECGARLRACRSSAPTITNGRRHRHPGRPRPPQRPHPADGHRDRRHLRRSSRPTPPSGAVVVTGDGAAFCAGADLSHLSSSADGGAESGLRSIYEGFLRVGRSPLPTIAAVNGAAVGAGMNLALVCDVRLAGHRGPVRHPVPAARPAPGGGHTWMFRRIAGPQAVAATVLFGEVLDGAEAERVGLVWRCVPDDELLPTAQAMAERAAAAPHELVAQDQGHASPTWPTIADHDAAVDRELDPAGVVPRAARLPRARRRAPGEDQLEAVASVGYSSHSLTSVLAALVPLLGGDGVADVVLPHAVDLEVAHGDALVADAELLDDAAAGGVAGDDRDLHAVQVELLEGRPAQAHDAPRACRPWPGLRLVDPVADVAALERAALHDRQVDLAGELVRRRRCRTP